MKYVASIKVSLKNKKINWPEKCNIQSVLFKENLASSLELSQFSPIHSGLERHACGLR